MRWQHDQLVRGPDRAARRTFTSRSPSSAPRPAGDACPASSRRCGRPLPQPQPVSLAVSGYRETRSVGMLVLGRRGRERPRLAREPCTSACSGSASTSPRNGPGFHTSRCVRFRRTPRPRSRLCPPSGGQSVRRRCLPFTCCDRSGAQYEVIESFAARRLIRVDRAAGSGHRARPDRAAFRQGRRS